MAALVSIIMGSETDKEYMKHTTEMLERLGIEHEIQVLSAHRTPQRLHSYVKAARERGIEVFIAGAGGAAHLPGAIASRTTLPVIGVPLPTSDLKGTDALYAIVQMPAGVPVATVAIGVPGARNAALLAAQILALKYPAIARAYEEYHKSFGDDFS